MVYLISLNHISGVEFITSFVVFLGLTFIGSQIVKTILNIDHKILNPREYLPEDEIHTLRQVIYLILMAACFVNVLYAVMFVESDLFYFTLLDLALSLYIAITIDKSTLKGKLLVVLLIPFGAISFLVFHKSIIGIVDFIHVPVFLYFIKYYYDRFKEYTTSHGLGITILLLFSIVFFSFILTAVVENENPLNALVMVSNAFTSNGYAVLGTSTAGKINSLVLVWSGFVISGVGTATLTAALLSRQFNKKFERLEQMIKDNKD